MAAPAKTVLDLDPADLHDIVARSRTSSGTRTTTRRRAGTLARNGSARNISP